jgi:hypothetical protein
MLIRRYLAKAYRIVFVDLPTMRRVRYLVKEVDG